MKAIGFSLSLLVALSLSRISEAALRSTPAAQINKIATHETQHNGSNWFELVGVTTLGTCPKNNNRILLAIADDERGRRQLALLTAAFLAGKNVVVTVDDVNFVGTICRTKALEVLR
jgi:hypothetical protein